jgi:hypothetical protein
MQFPKKSPFLIENRTLTIIYHSILIIFFENSFKKKRGTFKKQYEQCNT